MTELNRGEFFVTAEGGVTIFSLVDGRTYERDADSVRCFGYRTAEDCARDLVNSKGYTRVYPEAAESLKFPSGSVVLTDGSHITGRIEPQEGEGLGVQTGERFEEQRAPLPHFNQQTPFDTFGPGFKVRSDTGWMTGEDGHPLQRMTADSPTHGSAHLLAKP